MPWVTEGLTPWVGGAILLATGGAVICLLVRELTRARLAVERADGWPAGRAGPDELDELIEHAQAAGRDLVLETNTERVFAGEPDGYDGRWVKLLPGDGQVVLVDAESVVAAYVGDDPGTHLGG